MFAQPSFNLPMIDVAGFVFNVQSFIALDLTQYTEGAEQRYIVLHLVGPVEHYFLTERADKAWHWYLQLTGQARVEPLHNGLKLT